LGGGGGGEKGEGGGGGGGDVDSGEEEREARERLKGRDKERDKERGTGRIGARRTSLSCEFVCFCGAYVEGRESVSYLDRSTRYPRRTNHDVAHIEEIHFHRGNLKSIVEI
jgi:hypothetical protein